MATVTRMMIVWEIVNRTWLPGGDCENTTEKRDCHYSCRRQQSSNQLICGTPPGTIVQCSVANWRYIQDTLIRITYPQGHMHRNTSGYVSDNKPTAPTMTQTPNTTIQKHLGFSTPHPKSHPTLHPIPAEPVRACAPTPRRAVRASRHVPWHREWGA